MLLGKEKKVEDSRPVAIRKRACAGPFEKVTVGFVPKMTSGLKQFAVSRADPVALCRKGRGQRS